MNNDLSILRQIAITMAPQLNNRSNSPIFEKCGGIEGFFEEKDSVIETLFREHGKNYLPLERKEWLLKAGEEWKIMQKEGIYCCTMEDHRYPFLLQQCEDAPLVLFYKGELPERDMKMCAIVGTRKASERGKNRVDLIIKEIAEMGYKPGIVSGLAYGIDVSAHNACLKYGLPTYAVMGHGLNMVYPAQHRNIAEKIMAQGGGIISEFPCNTRILPINFLQRNRIVAGMCEAILVAESPVKGGAMATARQAFSYNREVMAIPGRPEDPTSCGCNLLIKRDIAALVENTEDILNILHWESRPLETPYQTSLMLFAETENEEKVKKILTKEGELNIDQLQALSGIPISELSSLLLTMELEGSIVQLPGKTYSLF